MNNTEKFINKAKQIHGNKYDYSKVEYKNSRTRVVIICPEHGEFLLMPETHLKGVGCPKCKKHSDKNLNKFVEKSRKKHGDRYDYSKVVYKGANEKVEIVCPIHGSFWIRASAHYNLGQGCPECGKIKMGQSHSNTLDEFINRSKEIHNDYYDYSLVRYISYNTPVSIICPTHGVFSQTPREHLQGCGCKKCNLIKLGNVVDTNSFIKKANLIHNNRYTYDKVKYINSKVKVTITCPIHGDFEQSPASHLKGMGCSRCAANTISKSNTLIYDEVISRCIDIYDNKYKYVYYKDGYINSKSLLEVICPIHGTFKIQAFKHLHGSGCPKCLESSGEIKVRTNLERLKCKYIYQAYFDFLGKLSYDFYLPDYNIAIEYYGKLHYEPIEIFGGEEAFVKQQERDSRKRKLSIENGINLIEIRYDQEKEDFNLLEEKIKNYIKNNSSEVD